VHVQSCALFSTSRKQLGEEEARIRTCTSTHYNQWRHVHTDDLHLFLISWDTCSGARLHVDLHVHVRSWAFAPGGDGLCIGTDGVVGISFRSNAMNLLTTDSASCTSCGVIFALYQLY